MRSVFMDQGLAAFLAGVFVFLGAVVGTVLGGLITLVMNNRITNKTLQHQSELAKMEQEETRRTARQEYLISLMLRLLDAYEEYEQYLAQYPHSTPKAVEEATGRVPHAKIIGKALAA